MIDVILSLPGGALVRNTHKCELPNVVDYNVMQGDRFNCTCGLSFTYKELYFAIGGRECVWSRDF